MKLTERDLRILQFINIFGFCETQHLSELFKISSKRTNQLTKRLANDGYLIKERLFHNQSAIYRLTLKGAQLTTLPPLSKISLGSYHHTIALIIVYLKVLKKYPNCTWIGERYLLNQKFESGVGKKGHIADALLRIDDKTVALEIELSLKSVERLLAIIREYGTNMNITEVWYFCSKEVLNKLKKIASHISYLKLYNLECLEDV